MMNDGIKGFKPIEERVQEHAVEANGIDVVEVPSWWSAKKVVCDRKEGIVYGWHECDFEIQGKHFIKYAEIFDDVRSIIEACRKAGFEPKEIIHADWIAKKEFYQG